MEQNIMGIGLLIGLVNVVKMTFPEVKGFWAFLISLGGGILMGYLGWFGVTGIEQGVLYAFVSSGTYKLVSKISGEKGQPNI
jgi:hypothetical protein